MKHLAFLAGAAALALIAVPTTAQDFPGHTSSENGLGPGSPCVFTNVLAQPVLCSMANPLPVTIVSGGTGGGGGDPSSTGTPGSGAPASVSMQGLFDGTAVRRALSDSSGRQIVTFSNTALNATGLVVSTVPTYTAGATQVFTMTTDGRLRVILGAATNIDPAAQAASTATSDLVACKYRATPATWTDLNTGALRCNSSGALVVDSSQTPQGVFQADVYKAGTIDATSTASPFVMPITNGQSTGGLVLAGLTASGATLVPEGSYDGTTWSTAPVTQVGSKVSVTALTTDGQYRFNAAARRAFRIRVGATGTGSITASSTLSIAPFDPPSPTLDALGNIGVNIVSSAPEGSPNDAVYTDVTGAAPGALNAVNRGQFAKLDNIRSILAALALQLPAVIGRTDGAHSLAVALSTDGTYARDLTIQNLALQLPASLGPKPAAQSFSAAFAPDTSILPTDMTPVTTTPGSSTGAVLFTADTTGYRGVSFQISGTFVAPYSIQGSNDASTWFAGGAVYTGGPSYATLYGTTVSTATSGLTGLFYTPANYRYVRVVLGTYTSGTATAAAYLKQTNLDPTPTATPVAINAGTTTIGNVFRSSYGTMSTTALAANATFTSLVIDVGQTSVGAANTTPVNMFSCFARSDQAGTLNQLGSTDNFVSSSYIEQSQPMAANTPTETHVRAYVRQHKCQVVNGTTAQGSLVVNYQQGE